MNAKTILKKIGIEQEKKTQLIWIGLSFFIMIFDQITKYWIKKSLVYSSQITLLPFLNLILSYNQGIAFGFLNTASTWIQIMLIIVAMTIIGFVIYTLYQGGLHYWTACGMSFVLGGAIGNLYDRIHYQYVIDFIDFHIGRWHFATFNIADSCICIGAILWLLDTYYISHIKKSMNRF